MHQIQKGNQWFFGQKVHIGVDVRTGLTHSLSTTVTNAHDITETKRNISKPVFKQKSNITLESSSVSLVLKNHVPRVS